MKTIEEIKTNRQVRLVLDKAAHYKLTALAMFDDEQNVLIKLSGDRAAASLAAREGKSWAKNAHVSGDEDGNCRFVWEREFFEPVAAPPTKPEGSLPDSEVLKLIPRSPIETKTMLIQVCGDLSAGLEKAYPGVLLSQSGYGLGKMALVSAVLDTLFAEGRISRQVANSERIVIFHLIAHLQLNLGVKLKLEEGLPTARARSPESSV